MLSFWQSKVVSGALLAIVLAAGAGIAGCGMGDADKAANEFLTDLKTSNYAAAYGMETTTLQSKFGGSATALEGQIKKFGQQPTEWSFNSINMTGGVARLHGSATFADGKKGGIDMELVKQDGKWQVASVGFAK
jgi:ABC-type glycerol-3-phosphate transport system substrate-binding protein